MVEHNIPAFEEYDELLFNSDSIVKRNLASDGEYLINLYPFC